MSAAAPPDASAPQAPAALRATGLCAGYGSIKVLHDIELRVQPGESVGVLGCNGMGKSTLLKTLMGLLPATGGSIRLQDEDVTGLPAYVRARQGIGYVQQGRGILPGLSARENLALAWRPGKAETSRQALDRVAARLPRVAGMLERPGGGLSGGEQQILALARAIIPQPRVLLLDEPSEGIQPSIRHEIGEFLVQLCKQDNLAILLVEQNLELALEVTQRLLVMERGRIKHQVDTSRFDLSQYANLLGIG